MHPSIDTAESRRLPTSAEVKVLCDLHYEVTGVFGDSTLAHHTDTLPVCGSRIASIEDGRGACYYGNYIVGLTDTLVVDSFLYNDENASSYTCLEVLVGGADIVNETDSTFELIALTAGKIRLVYTPVDSNGNEGNYSCIYVTVLCDPVDTNVFLCTNLDGCNQICNAGFSNVNINIVHSGNTIPWRNPFREYVPGWVEAKYSPQWHSGDLWTGCTAPPNWGLARIRSEPNEEGIGTCVDVKNGKQYIFSTYKTRFTHDTLYSNSLDSIYIRLSSSSNDAFPFGGQPPNLPHQELFYFTSVLDSLVWRQHVMGFTATQDWDQLWFWAEGNTNENHWLFVDQVELIEDTFSAGPDQTILCSESAIIGSDVCSVDNMVYEWRKLGDTSIMSTGPLDTVSPSATTTYTLLRTFIQSNSCYPLHFDGALIRKDTVTITVSPGPDANFTHLPDSADCADEFSFTSADSVNGSHLWDFDDGNTSTQANPTHNYQSGGTFNITHIHTVGACKDTVVQTLILVLDGAFCCVSGFDYGSDFYFQNASASDLVAQFSNTVFTTQKHIVFDDTLTIDTSITFLKCPKIWMGPWAVIIIETGKQLTIDSSTVKAACDTVWRGIQLSNSTSEIEITYTTIEDADKSVFSDNGAQVRIENSQFYNNRYHIEIEDASDTLDGHIHSTVFHATDSLLHPYSTKITERCILIERSKYVEIGDDSQAGYQNSFKGFEDYGVYALKSNVKVLGCYFDNSDAAYTGHVGSSHGVYTKGASPGYKLIIGDTVDYAADTFKGLQHGILTELNYQSNVLGNHFHNCSSRAFTGSENQKDNFVTDNTFNNCPTSIHFAEMDWADKVIIANNTITSGPNHTGIRVDEFSSSNKTVEVTGNTITGVRFGINVLLGYAPLIEGNTVNFITPHSASATFGIYTQNCEDPRIFNNDINNSDTSKTDIYGIAVASGDSAYVCSNTVDSVEFGIAFQSWVKYSTVELNEMSVCDVGLLLTNGGRIDQQGDSLAPSDNRWINSDTWDTYTRSGSFGNDSEFFVRNNNPF